MDESVALLEAQPGVLAAWHDGSVGDGTDDEYSDVDPVFIIEDAHFRELEKNLPDIFARISPDIVLFWPERVNNEYFYNYAIFIKYEGELIQYDFNALTLSALENNPYRLAKIPLRAILFEKDGMLTKIINGLEKKPDAVPSRETVARAIETFWLYAYINVKYLRRRAVYKIAYALEELRTAHLVVMNGLAGGGKWNWWAGALTKNTDAAQKEEMLVYFGGCDIERMKADFYASCDLFSRDARRLCTQSGADYPEKLEREVREHMAKSLK